MVTNRQKSVALLAALLAAVFAFGPSSRAQSRSSVVGTVLDPTGAPVPQAAVVVKNAGTGMVRRARTDAAGRYSIMALPPGLYSLRVARRGFETAQRTAVPLAVGEQKAVNFQLKLGPIEQRVTVRAEPALVSVSTTGASGIVGAREVKDLPLNGRSYDQLMTLDPGVVNYTSEKTGGVGVSNSAVANMFAVSGRRPQENLFLLNGVEYTGEAEINLQPGGTSGQLLGVDAIREFNVLTNNYGAQYGKRPGAQVIIDTESGTNRLHGSLYEYLRNSAFDARNFFDSGSIPRFERNQFGAALGGPVQKNRTFLFGNFEGFRQHLGLSDVTLVPDEQARLGFLPGPGGTLDNVGIAAGVAPLLALWPSANGPELGGGIALAYSHPLQTLQENFGTARLDHEFTGRDSLTGVYTIDDSSSDTPTSNPLSLDLENLGEQVFSLAETHIFSPAAVNTARFGFSRAAYFYTGKTSANVPGFIAGKPVGAVVIGGSATPNSQSQISLAGDNIGSNLYGARNLFTYEDKLSATRGAHQLSFGVWFERVQANDRWALTQYGQAAFSNLTSFLEGQVTNFSAIPNPTLLGWRSLEGAFYAQDAMRLRQNLTLRVGLRAELTNGWNEAFGRAANYVFNAAGVIEAEPHVGRSALAANHAKLLPEPRVGLAWSPPWHSKTVLRAGFGLYDDLQDGLSYRLDQNAPFNTAYSLTDIPLTSLPLEPASPPLSGAKISPGGVQPSLFTPTVESYSLTLEQQLTSSTVLRIGYVGSHAYHEIVSIDANEPTPVICPAAPCPAALAAGTIYYPKGAPLANPLLANTWSWFSEGTISYNALRVDLNRRFARGLEFRGVYTWAKSLDNGDTLNGSAAANAPGLVMDPANLSLDWGPSTFDTRQAAVLDGSWKLPIGPGEPVFGKLTGWSEKLLGGWTLDGIETLESGFPFTPQLSFNPSNNGDTRNPDRPSFNPQLTGPVILGNPNRYFNPNTFAIPPNGTYGNVGRDTFTGPAIATLDLALLKRTPLTEKLSAQFRAEFFNLLNHPNFNTPNLIVFTSPGSSPSSAAGIITGTSTSAREIQFALKLIW